MKKNIFKCAIAMWSLSMSLLSAGQLYCPVECDPCGVQPFEGFYVGGNVGALSHIAHRNDLDGFLTDNSGWSTIDTNATAGAQIGFDWQCGNKVVGLVGDWNWANNKRRLIDNPNDTEDAGSFIESEMNWFATIRARAGLTVCDALVYVTAGAAVAHFDVHWNDNDISFRHGESRWGWTGGVGTELKFDSNWSIGAETLGLFFNNYDKTFTNTDSTFTFGHSNAVWVGRVTVNYRFGDWCF